MLKASILRIMLLWLGLVCGAWAQPLATFPMPSELEAKVEFWRDVFANYSEHQMVLHDRHNTTIVYKVLDFSDVVPLLDEEELWLHKKKIEKEEKARLKEQLTELAGRLNETVLPIELARLKQLFIEHDAFDREKILQAADSLRGQRGLREKTIEAIRRSGRYLPFMEETFELMGLPVMLTRLPIVESSFNNAAYSKTGAAGVWQFMPGSARIYMRYDEIGDQRRDPWFSTEAAAKHLRDDFELLQDWPLAVTAYNFGRNGIARALAEIEGDSLVDMIERYEHPRWGFAGKNFYAEFLAAVDVEQNALRYFGPIRRDDPVRFAEIKTRHYLPYSTLQRISGVSPEQFVDLNPGFSTAVQRGDLYVPPGSRIRVPIQQAKQMQLAHSQLASGEVFSSQRSYFRTHRVRRGDTLSGLARRYKSSVKAILQANDLRSRHTIRIGQNLKIPSPGAAMTPTVHVVRSGETLGEIARRYGVSVGRLQKQNGIKRADMIKVGSRLKVKASSPTVVAFHTVRPGETLSGIARRYGVSVSSLKRDNGIRRPEALQAGKRLRIAAARAPASVAFHVIRSGQTLETIARQYGTSVREIAQVNGLSDVNRVRAGQRLRLPEG